jgi:hypothetical protein
MSNWALKCKVCGNPFTFAEIEDTLENFFLPARLVVPREGVLQCPFCLTKLTYLPTELVYRA